MRFGLIGYPLEHSFSQAYFTGKFNSLGLSDYTYTNFPLPEIENVHAILHSDVFGLNITIPYKSSIINYINDIDPTAWKIGAVNTLVRTGPNSWKGFNTDVIGFSTSLMEWLGEKKFIPEKALILGSGGSSKAVCFALEEIGVETSIVSRSENATYHYRDLDENIMETHLLIINTTPLGMDPDTNSAPEIPYETLTSAHCLFDLVYNPPNTVFLTRGQQAGAKTKNGLDMLRLQAEQAWAIWKLYGKF